MPLNLRPIIEQREPLAIPEWDRKAAQERLDDLVGYAELFGAHEGTALAADLMAYTRALDFPDNVVALPIATFRSAIANKLASLIDKSADALAEIEPAELPAKRGEIVSVLREIAQHVEESLKGDRNAA